MKNNNNKLHEKILDPNNSAYSDGFFSFLSSLLLNRYNFYNGIDYYGSFLGIKKDFVIDIEDDIEYLDESEFFHKNNNILFKIEETENYKNIFSSTKRNRQSINIEANNLDELDIEFDNIDSIQEIEYKLDDINITLDNSNNVEIEYNNINTDIINDIKNKSNNSVNDNDNDNDNNDNDNNNKIKNKKAKTNEQNESISSCSSRFSNTESSNENDIDSDEDDNSEDESSTTEEELFAVINKFPVQTIALECCDDTLDSYIINNKIKDDEWESIVLQIVFCLIAYQKVFDFTHNDLHTNNVVYIKTEKKFLYYKYDNVHYKVPTHGKIYKIIDFGRAIYRFKGSFICSDSYATEGDAHTQYNCEPYFNEEKPRLEPNNSFDLCRLGCSLFDYFIEDLDDIQKLKSPIKKEMVKWVYDDSGKNILYKNNGSERYPDFKLYKMIARTVHNHTPQKVIKNPLFEKYLISKKRINLGTIINIDTLPIMV